MSRIFVSFLTVLFTIHDESFSDGNQIKVSALKQKMEIKVKKLQAINIKADKVKQLQSIEIKDYECCTDNEIFFYCNAR